MVRDGACHDPHIYLRCTGALQAFRKLMQCRAAGHDVIHHGDVLAAQILVTGKRAFHVLVPCIDRQRGLRRRVHHALGKAGSKWDIESFGDDFGDLQRLIEAARFEPRRVQRHRQDDFGAGLVGNRLGQHFSEQFG